MHAVIFTGGGLRASKLVRDTLATADIIIAADSGAKTAVDFKVLPSVVIGDFDSLDAATKKDLEAKGVRFIIHERDKDQTDTELAVAYATKNHATLITILGGLEGDRIDHVLANVFSVIKAKVPVRLVNGPTMAWIMKGPATTAINGHIGDLVSLVPLTPRASGIRTSGLRYPLSDESLRMDQARGVSNVMTRTKAKVGFEKGALLLVHSEVHPV